VSTLVSGRAAEASRGRARGVAIEGWIDRNLRWLLPLPAVGTMALLLVFPLVYTAYLSLHEWYASSDRGPQWVGLQNYWTMVHDPIFWQSLKVTLTYVLMSVPLYLVAGLGVSLLLNMKRRGVNLFRTVVFLPYVISGVAVAIMWSSLLDPNFGGVNWLLRHLGVANPPLWLESPTWALPAVVLIGLWAVGGGAIIYLAGLQNIPEQLYEAAAVDGAGMWQRFRYVTFPMLTPTLLFVLLTSLVSAFQVFDVVFVLAGGPQGTASSALNFYLLNMWTQGFGNGRLGYASGLAWILVVISGLVIAVIFRTGGRWVYYEHEG